MKPIRTAVVVGAGATGGVAADTLSRSGVKVSVLTRDAAAARALKRAGLRVDGRKVRLAAVSDKARDLGPCDALLFCVKSADTPPAVRRARTLAGPATAVLSLQNGFGHVRGLRRAFGARMVFAGAYFAADREGHVVRRLGGNRIDLGRSTRNEAAAVRLKAALSKAGWDCTVPGDEDQVLWTKLILNAAINPLGALADCSNGELAARPALRELMWRAAVEAERSCRDAGVKPLVSDAAAAAVRLCKETASNVNSMARDLREGRPTEVDAILLPVLHQSRHPETATPVLFGLYRFVRGLEKRLK